MNERIKKLRKTLNLTQQEFADRISISRGAVATYEVGRNEPIDAVIASICREFNVSETWLRTGKGEMFAPETAFDLGGYARQHGMTDLETDILKAYLDLDVDMRDKLLQHFKTWFAKKTALDAGGQQRVKLGNMVYITKWYSSPMSAGTGTEAGNDEPEELELCKRPPRGTSYVAPVTGDSMEPTYCDGDKLFIRTCEEIEVGQIGVFFMDGQQWVKELGDGVLISHNPDYPPRPMTEDVRCQGLVLGVCDESYFL